MRTHQAFPPLARGSAPTASEVGPHPWQQVPQQAAPPSWAAHALPAAGRCPAGLQVAARVPSMEALLPPGDACISTRRQTVPNVPVCHFLSLC